MGKPYSCMQFIKSHIFCYKSRENPYQVLSSHMCRSERAMKLKARMIISLSPWYQAISDTHSFLGLSYVCLSVVDMEDQCAMRASTSVVSAPCRRRCTLVIALHVPSA